MTPRERVLKALRLEKTDQVPFFDWFDPQIKQTVARHYGAEKPVDDFEFSKIIGMDAVSMNAEDMDPININPFCPPLFCKTLIDEDGRAHFTGEGKIITDSDKEKLFHLPDPKSDHLYEGAKRFIDKYGKEDLALYTGFRTGVFNTVFSMGITEFSYALFKRRAFVEDILDQYTEWTCTVLEKVNDLGFDFIADYDDLAFNTGPMFSPQVFKELFLPRMQKIADVIKLPWVFHSDGKLDLVLEDIVGLGMNAINPIQPDVMDINSVKKEFGDRICVWGNIDLTYTLTRGTCEEVEAEVKMRLKETAPDGGFIFASSNSIPDYCKPENIITMLDTFHKYKKYPINID